MHVQLVGMSPTIFNSMYSHSHDMWEIVLNYHGNGFTEIGNRSYSFSPGSILCQPPHIPHSKSSAEGFRDIYIQPSSFPLERLVDENGVLAVQDDSEKSFQTLLFMAHRIFHNQQGNEQGLLDALLEAMFQFLLCRHRSAPVDPDVEQLKNKIILSFSDSEFSVSRLLEESPYCSDHMRRRFRQVTGQTPLEYLTGLRIEYAKKLLRENGRLHYTIGEIGAMAGYYDAHYFSRSFKKHAGMTPAEYQCSPRQDPQE